MMQGVFLILGSWSRALKIMSDNINEYFWLFFSDCYEHELLINK